VPFGPSRQVPGDAPFLDRVVVSPGGRMVDHRRPRLQPLLRRKPPPAGWAVHAVDLPGVLAPPVGIVSLLARLRSSALAPPRPRDSPRPSGPLRPWSSSRPQDRPAPTPCQPYRPPAASRVRPQPRIPGTAGPSAAPVSRSRPGVAQPPDPAVRRV
jgi:hypothetical protein